MLSKEKNKYILKIRGVDKIVFDCIKNNQKIIETRAATKKYRNIKIGDILVFACADNKLEKTVKKIEIYRNINEMVKVINFKDIMPFLNSVEEMEKVCFSFPNYKEKIKQFGIIAFTLE